MIEEPSAVLVRSRVPRTGAAFAGVRKCRGCARRPTTTAARAAALVSRGCSPGESGVAGSPRPSRLARVAPAREFDPGVVTGAGAQTGGSEKRLALAARLARRLSAQVRCGFGEPGRGYTQATVTDSCRDRRHGLEALRPGRLSAIARLSPDSPRAPRGSSSRSSRRTHGGGRDRDAGQGGATRGACGRRGRVKSETPPTGGEQISPRGTSVER